MSFIDELERTNNLLDHLCVVAAFVAGQKVGICSFAENFTWSVFLCALFFCLKCLCKKGFALVKRKFGKEK